MYKIRWTNTNGIITVGVSTFKCLAEAEIVKGSLAEKFPGLNHEIFDPTEEVIANRSW